MKLKEKMKRWWEKETKGEMYMEPNPGRGRPKFNETKSEPGKRDDGGKLMWHLLPIPALIGLCRVFHAGAIKYAAEQWRKGMSYSRIYRPMMSHLNKWLASKSSFDKELGTHHLMMVAWGCFVLYMYEMFLFRDDRFDDRPDKGLLDDSQFDPIKMPIYGDVPWAQESTKMNESGPLVIRPATEDTDKPPVWPKKREIDEWADS